TVREQAVLLLAANLRPNPGGVLDEGSGAPCRRSAGAVGRVAGAAPSVKWELQHAKLFRRHRHLVRRERLELVEAPLVVIGRSVRTRQLDVLLVMQCIEHGGRAQPCGRRETTAAHMRVVDSRRRGDQTSPAPYQ